MRASRRDVEARFQKLLAVVNAFLLLIGYAYMGVALSFMWGWFVPAPPISVWGGIGIILIVKLTLVDFNHLLSKYLDEYFENEMGRRILWDMHSAVLTTSIIWALGWIVHYRPWGM